MDLIIPGKRHLLLLMAKLLLVLLFALVLTSGVIYVLTSSHLALLALVLSTVTFLLGHQIIEEAVR